MTSKVETADKSTPYATVELYSFDALINGVDFYEAIANLFAQLGLSAFPDEFKQKFASKNFQTSGLQTEEFYANSLDTYEPARIFRNALRFIARPAIKIASDQQLIDPAARRAVTTTAIKAFQDQMTTPRVGLLVEPWKLIIDGTIDSLKALTETQLGKNFVPPQSWERGWTSAANTLKDESYAIQFAHMLAYMGTASAIGLMHRYRQHFYYGDVVEGPIELIRSLAPNEELEIISIEQKSSTVEETTEIENEITTERSIENKDSLELSTRVSQSLMNATTSVVQGEGGYNALIWNASGSASNTVTSSSQSTAEQASKKLLEATAKQSEQIRKKTRITTKSVESRTTTNTNRQFIKNSSNAPLSYGLKRLGYKVRTRIQDLGPQLVWQTKITRPGQYLARPYIADLAYVPITYGTTAKVIQVTLESTPQLESAPAAVFSVAKALIEAFETQWAEVAKIPGITSAPEYAACYKKFYTNKTYGKPKMLGRMLESDKGGHDGSIWVNESTKLPAANSNALAIDDTYTCTFLTPVRFPRVTITFQIEFDDWPTSTSGGYVPDIISKKTAEAVSSANPQLINHMIALLETKFLLDNSDGKSPTRRSEAGLRFEEKKAILAHILATVGATFFNGDGLTSTVFMLYLRVVDIFDLSQLFFDPDTSEWSEAAFLRQTSGKSRAAYPIHSAASGSAPIGSSLGWQYQADADFRRNAFINAPFVWACLPVKPGKETAAMLFLEEQGLITPGTAGTEKLVKQLRVLRVAERLFGGRDVIKLSDSTEVTTTPAGAIRKWLEEVDTTTQSIEEIEKISDRAKFAAIFKIDGKVDEVFPIVGQSETFVTIEGAAFETLLDKAASPAKGASALVEAGFNRAAVVCILLLVLLVFIVLIKP